MRYLEQPPSTALAPWVRCVWQLDARLPPGAAVPLRGLPDGRADVLFDLGERALARHEDRGLGAALVGPLTRAATATLRGAPLLFGVSFRPGAARAFFGLPLAELADGQCALDESAAGRAWSLAPRLAEAPDFGARVALVEALLRRRAGDLDPAAALVARACARVEAAPRRASVAALRRWTGWGERRLERRFRDAVGLAPRAFLGVARFQAAKELLAARPDAPQAQVALAAGYYDQAHLHRAFRRHAGLAPGAWLAERAGVGSVQSAPAPEA